MPAYEWTCKECDAKVRGLGSYHPGPTRQPCKKFLQAPLLMSNRCLFSDPKLIDIDEV